MERAKVENIEPIWDKKSLNLLQISQILYTRAPRFMMLLIQLSYAMKRQGKNAPYEGHFLPFAVSL